MCRLRYYPGSRFEREWAKKNCPLIIGGEANNWYCSSVAEDCVENSKLYVRQKKINLLLENDKS